MISKTPLFEIHKKLGAKMTPFGGWDMPLQYQGIVAEHMQTRQSVGLFDICHMGEFELEGKGAGDFLERKLTCSPKTIPVGKCRYGLMLDESGCCIDDVITYCLAEDFFMLVVNASTAKGDFVHLGDGLPEGIRLEDKSSQMGKLDLQGPKTPEVLKELFGFDLSSLKYFEWTEFRDGLISRTGYTGEWGVEIYCPAEKVCDLWEEMVSHALVEPIGLGARDTIRLECGMSLYGHELDSETSALYCGVDRFIKWDTPFLGREALLKEKDSPTYKMVGLRSPNKSAPRAGEKVLFDGECVGEITSGSMSPSLGCGIALCRIKSEYAENLDFVVDKGRRQAPVSRCDLPFYIGTARKKIG